MIKKYRWLIAVMIIYYAVFFGSGRLVRVGGSSSYLLSAAGAVICFLLYGLIYHPRAFAAFKSGEIGGTVRMIIGAAVLISALVQAVAVCTWSVKSVSQVFMKKSPFPYILFFMMLPSLVGAYFDIKSVARYAFLCGVSIVSAVGLIFIFGAEGYSAKNLYPLMGRGFDSFKNLLTAAAVYANVFYIFILGAGAERSEMRKETGKILLISGLFFAAVCLMCNLSVPYEVLGLLDDPLLYVASAVDFSFLVERSEALVFLIRIFLSFLCLSALMCFVCNSAVHAFSLSDRKAVIGAAGIIIASGALLADKYCLAEPLIVFSLIWTFAASVLVPVILRIAYALAER